MSTSIDVFRNCKKIFISGAVGVGKTTVLHNFIDHATTNNKKIHVIPEFVDGDPNGCAILKDFLSNKISAFIFQFYILEFYEKYIASIIEKVNADDYVLFERLPDESVLVFANTAMTITKQELLQLYNKSIEIDYKYGIPSLFDTNIASYSFACLKTITDKNLCDIILQLCDINDSNNIIIGLYNSPEECYKRVCFRARDGENAYTVDRITMYEHIYENIYSYLVRHKNISFNIMTYSFIN